MICLSCDIVYGLNLKEVELIAQIIEESILEFGLKYASALDELIVERTVGTRHFKCLLLYRRRV